MATRFSGSSEERLALDVFIKLNRASLSVGKAVHAPLREAGLTPIQFGVLDALHFLGPMPITVLAEKNLCSQNSISTVVDTMERNGLVRRVRSREDRRVVQVEMTEAGAATFLAIWPGHLAKLVEVMGNLDEGELVVLNGLLKKLGIGVAKDLT